MANLVVTSTTNSTRVDFGVYSGSLERLRGVWRKENIKFTEATNFVEVSIQGEKAWYVSHDGNNTTTPTFQIDTVDAATPTSVADLFLKLQTLIA